MDKEGIGHSLYICPGDEVAFLSKDTFAIRWGEDGVVTTYKVVGDRGDHSYDLEAIPNPGGMMNFTPLFSQPSHYDSEYDEPMDDSFLEEMYEDRYAEDFNAHDDYPYEQDDLMGEDDYPDDDFPMELEYPEDVYGDADYGTW